MTEAARVAAAEGEQPRIVGRSAATLRALRLVEQFAPTRLPILLVGATGTGKELFARLVHHLSARPGELVDVNCAALPPELADSLLFGHRRGAFSGAIESTIGLLEQADGGTLFLDELGSLPLPVQAKLLRVLETGELLRVGEAGKRRVALRVVAAAHDDLHDQVRSCRFRTDLYQRLAGVLIDLPRLPERREDIAPLAEAFAAEHGRGVSACGASYLERQPWQGNVRELKLAVERAAWLSRAGALSAGVLAEAVRLGVAARTFGEERLRDELLEVCRELKWDVPAILARTELSRATLYRRLRERGIQPSAERRRW